MGSTTFGTTLGSGFGVGFLGSSGSFGSEGNGLVVAGFTLPLIGLSGNGVGVGGVGSFSFATTGGSVGSCSRVGFVGSTPFLTSLYLITILIGVISRGVVAATSPRTTGTSIVRTSSPTGRALTYVPSFGRYGNFGFDGNNKCSPLSIL